jgi:hypothetical protein
MNKKRESNGGPGIGWREGRRDERYSVEALDREYIVSKYFVVRPPHE